jgi:hypothetical protein
MADLVFPSTTGDQPITVVAKFSTRNDSIVSLVSDYVKAWTRANKIWTRIWRSNIVWEEKLELDTDFSSDPRVIQGTLLGSFSIVLEVRPHSSRWKDWMARLMGEISRVFHEIKLEGFERG